MESNELFHTETPLIRVSGLKKHFDIKGKGKLHAVDGIDFEIYPHETLGLVGESGCGKSTVGNLVTGLLDPTAGELYYKGTQYAGVSKKNISSIRQNIQMIFQDPYSSLNPRHTIMASLLEPFKINKGLCKGIDVKEHITGLVKLVGLDPYILSKYPHELDGGKRQLIGVVRALTMNPQFIVCDEPVSALDVSVQATIINYLIEMQKRFGMAYLFISHDLSVVKHISHRVAVMYLGQIVEIAPTEEIFSNTCHPYSIALLSAVPQIDFDTQSERIVLKGDVPSPVDPKPGCRFAPRCWMARPECFEQNQHLQEVTPGHFVACSKCMEISKNNYSKK